MWQFITHNMNNFNIKKLEHKTLTLDADADAGADADADAHAGGMRLALCTFVQTS